MNISTKIEQMDYICPVSLKNMEQIDRIVFAVTNQIGEMLFSTENGSV